LVAALAALRQSCNPKRPKREVDCGQQRDAGEGGDRMTIDNALHFGGLWAQVISTGVLGELAWHALRRRKRRRH
jgi:hypothetical protein